jgi:hypothetical protein
LQRLSALLPGYPAAAHPRHNAIIGSSQAPYFNTLAKECGLATNFHNITHPSLPNYIAATSGLSYSALHNFLPDCSPKAGCWDEGEGGHYAKGEHCATNTSDVSCHIATLVISPSTKAGARSGTRFNHYSLLGTAEQLLRLSKLGQAASSPTMTKAFNL